MVYNREFYKKALLSLLMGKFPTGFYHWVNGEFVFYVKLQGKVWTMTSLELSMDIVSRDSSYVDYISLNHDMMFCFFTNIMYSTPEEVLFHLEERYSRPGYKSWKKRYNKNSKESDHYPW